MVSWPTTGPWPTVWEPVVYNEASSEMKNNLKSNYYFKTLVFSLKSNY